MLKRLEQEAIRADLMAVEALLATIPQEEDPVGSLQFSQRKNYLESQLAELDAKAPSSSIAMLFGGRPVVGSQGIAADFSSTMIGNVQALVSTQWASSERPLGERGPIPQRDLSQMFITDFARGSAGFVFENIGQTPTDVAAAMDAVCDLLARLSSPDATVFNAATEDLDGRMLPALRNFFRTLHDGGATVKLVSETQDYELTRDAISIAIERTEALRVSDPYQEEITGRVFMMPDSKRFELFPIGGLPVIKGSTSVEFVREMFDKDFVASGDFIGKILLVKLRVRDTTMRGGSVRKSYQLLGVEEPATQPAANIPPIPG